MRFGCRSAKLSLPARTAAMARITIKAAMQAKVSRSVAVPAAQDCRDAHSMRTVRVPPQAKSRRPVPSAAMMAGVRSLLDHAGKRRERAAAVQGPPDHDVEQEADRRHRASHAGGLGEMHGDFEAAIRAVRAQAHERAQQRQRQQKGYSSVPDGISHAACVFARRREFRRWPFRDIHHPAYTFSTSGRPSSPDGMKISTMARMENAATSLYCAVK